MSDRDKVAELLGDDYACNRVWEAWQVGTMTQDDFILLSDTERVDEIVELIQNARKEEHEKLLEYMNTPATRLVTYRNSPSAAFDDGVTDAKTYIKKWLKKRRKEIDDSTRNQ